MLRLWNLNLIIATFLLTILGTFLTRSGILSSVHAFAGGEIGYYFLSFIALVLLFSLGLLSSRGGELRSEGRLDRIASRDTVFLLNNLLLSAFTFTVLLGTLFPLVAEAVRGVKLSVGAPFFNRMTLPLAVALLFLMGVGPALPWGAAREGLVKKKLRAPAVAMALTAAVALLAGVPSAYATLAFAFAAFALMVNAQEFVQGTRARMRAHGESAFRALGRLVAANRHRYGGYVAHIGVVLIAVGIAASSAYRQEYEATLRTGEAMRVGELELRPKEVWAASEPHRFVLGADVEVLRGGERLDVLVPRMNFYATRSEPVPTPAVRSRLTDLYVNLMAIEPDGSSLTLSVVTEPLVSWIWLGGLVVALGALIALWPDSRRRRERPVPIDRLRQPRELAATGGD